MADLHRGGGGARARRPSFGVLFFFTMATLSLPDVSLLRPHDVSDLDPPTPAAAVRDDGTFPLTPICYVCTSSNEERSGELFS